MGHPVHASVEILQVSCRSPGYLMMPLLQIELLYIVLFMVAGLLLYFPFVHKWYRVPGIERVYAAVGRALNLTKREKDELT